MSERWAFCGRCDRWFYAADQAVPDIDQVRCPVCDQSPTAIRTDAGPDITAVAS